MASVGFADVGGFGGGDGVGFESFGAMTSWNRAIRSMEAQPKGECTRTGLNEMRAIEN